MTLLLGRPSKSPGCCTDVGRSCHFDELFRGRHVQYSFNTRIAIRAACDLLGLNPGDEVLAPAYNCGSELDPLLAAGLSVKLYPIGMDLVASPRVIEDCITHRTRAVYVTHYFGFTQPHLDEVRELCSNKGLRLMEDCALNLFGGREPPSGRLGDVSFFSFYKSMPVLAGGALVLNATDLPKNILFTRPPPRTTEARYLMRKIAFAMFGSTHTNRMKGLFFRLRGQRPSIHHPVSAHPDMPANYYFDPKLNRRRMSAITLHALRSINFNNQIISSCRENWQAYKDMLSAVKEVELLIPDLAEDACPIFMPVLVGNRNQIAARLKSEGINATPWWAGYNKSLNWTNGNVAMFLKDNVLALPLNHMQDNSSIQQIVRHLEVATKH